MNIKCTNLWCDHNTGFTDECMFGITEDLIEKAKSNAPMCNHLKTQVLNLVEKDQEI